MRYLFNKIKFNPNKTLLNSTMFFITFSVLFLSINLNSVNKKISDYLFNKLGINVILYGDICDIDTGYETDINDYKKIYEILGDTANYISSNNIGIVNYEQELCNTKLYSGKDIYDDDLYELVLFSTTSYDGDYLTSVSKNINDNRQYVTSMDSYYEDPNEEESIFSYRGEAFYPTLIGVSGGEFSDLTLGSMNIVSGRTFNNEEIEEGEYLAVVNYETFLINRDEIRRVEIGDYIPITIEYNGQKQEYEFKVIGINDGIESSLETQMTYYYENEGSIYSRKDDYRSMIYIPNKCYEEIRNSLLDIYEHSEIKPSKQTAISYDEVIAYGQYGGIRPIVITINNLENYKQIVSYVAEVNNELNDISDRPIKYTYFSNLDRFALVVSNMLTNEKLLSFVSKASILVTLFILIIFVLSDIENNKQEIAICVALGKTKLQVLFNLFIEYLLESIGPIIFSILLSNYIGNKYVNNLNNNLIDITSAQTILGEYVETITINQNNLIYLLVVCVVIICFLISLGFGYFKFKDVSIKKILMEGDSI